MRLAAYPKWVCEDCALNGIERFGAEGKRRDQSSWHYGLCDVCNQQKSVTEPRDFGFPKWPVEEQEGLGL